MFQFRRFPSYAYFVQRRMTGYCPAGLPHSDISGSTLICSSPKLFAAYHVLHRLLMPRHSPCALLRLTFVRISIRFVGISIRSTPFPPQALGLHRKLRSASLFLLPNSSPLRWALNLYTGVEINTRSVSVHRLRSGRKPHSTSLFRLVFQLRKVHNWFSSSELCRLMFRSLF